MSEAAPEISICLPVFNAELFLPACIESILNQTFSDFELLISDDGSTDGSQELILAYAEKDKRIKYWRNEKNLGAVRNYNECFRKSRGLFIKPFGADDVMHAQHLEKLSEKIRSDNSIALASCARKIIDAKGEPGDTASSFSETAVHNGLEIIHEALARIVYVNNLIGEPSCVLFRKASMKEEGFNKDYYHITDLDLWLQILKSGNLHYIVEPLCYYRKHRDTTTTNNFKSLYYALDFLRIMDRNMETTTRVFGSREAAYQTVAEHLGRFVSGLLQEQTVSLETISANLLNSKNPLYLQSGIVQPETVRPETLSDEEYFRLLALFALARSGETARRLDSTYADLTAQIASLQGQIDGMKNSKAWKSIGWIKRQIRMS